MHEVSKPALVAVWDVPFHVQQNLQARATQIMPADLLAVPLTLLAVPDVLRGKDIIFFIDNQSAMAALIRACSSVSDCSLLALLTSVLTLSLRVRPWFEYVNTKQNPADVLSRQGYADATVRSKIDAGAWQPVHHRPDWESQRYNKL